MSKVLLDIPDDALKRWKTYSFPSEPTLEDRYILNTALLNAVEVKGVLIENMEMPKNCKSCPICFDEDCNFVRWTDKHERAYGCPLKDIQSL